MPDILGDVHAKDAGVNGFKTATALMHERPTKKEDQDTQNGLMVHIVIYFPYVFLRFCPSWFLSPCCHLRSMGSGVNLGQVEE